MTHRNSTHDLEWRILILAPLAGDAEILCRFLTESGRFAAPCRDVQDLCRDIEEGAAAAVICEEALAPHGHAVLARALEAQPEWSDLPIVVLATRGHGHAEGWRMLQSSRASSHAFLLDRPVGLAMLITTVNAAAACRARQYKLRQELERRRRAEEHLRLVTAELDHRVRNTLATVDSLARQSARHAGSPEELSAALGDRLRSLADAHGLLTRADWKGTTIRDIVETEVMPRLASPECSVFRGPDLMLPPQAALGLHMAVHELATNAAKYGAASVDHGRIEVNWSVNKTPEPTVQLSWTESGGPPVTAPTRTGFGTGLVHRLVERQLGGEIRTDFPPQGMHCEIRFPLRSNAGEEAPPPPDAALLATAN